MTLAGLSFVFVSVNEPGLAALMLVYSAFVFILLSPLE